jgi:hypothetical protein
MVYIFHYFIPNVEVRRSNHSLFKYFYFRAGARNLRGCQTKEDKASTRLYNGKDHIILFISIYFLSFYFLSSFKLYPTLGSS